jgi:hypothetical protein
MRASIFSISVLNALAAIATPMWSAESVSGAVVSRLCEHVKARKIMHVDRSEPEIIWSDGAMFEIAKSFPRELDELLATPTATRDLRPILKRMVPNAEQGWQEAKIVRPGRGPEHAAIQSRDGKLIVEVASPYFAYLHGRYPGARIWLKDPLNPVLFMVDATLRGAVMPIAKAASTKSSQPK